MKISYRMGKPDDAYQIAELLHVASGGISDFLLNDILPNCDLIDLITLGVTDKAATISFSKTLIAETNKQILAILNFYPAEDHKIPDIMRSFIPADRITHIEPLFSKSVPDSLYLHALAAKPKAEHIAKNSVGRCLFLKAVDYAKSVGVNKLSAHVWLNNDRVLEVALKLGFEVYHRISFPYHPLLAHRNEMLLLSYTIK